MRATPLLLLLAACAPEVPAEPTWIDDVRPILAANCIRCHSPPYIGGVPEFFRFDIYQDDTYVLPGFTEGVYGAVHMSESGDLTRVVEDGTMPPRFPLGDRQVEVIAAWHEAEEPKGEPRAGNAVPTMTLTSDIDIDPGRVGFHYDIADGDGDIVTGVVVADPGGGADPAPIVATNELFAGRGSVRFSLPTGTFELMAELDDGHERVTVELGMAVVP